MIVPPIKIHERGEVRRDVFDMIVANSRLAHWLEGDFDAMIGACTTAARRIQELLERYGVDDLRKALDDNIAYTERRVRAEIGSWRDGTYTAETFVDHDHQGHTDIPIKCTATVSGEDLHLDFTGSAPQVAGFVNSPIANTLSFVFIAISTCCEEDIPINEGYMNPVTVTAPEGTIVNPLSPAPVGQLYLHLRRRDHRGGAAGAIAVRARARRRSTAHKLPLAYSNGAYADGRRWVNLNFFSHMGGAGAAYGTDGWGLSPPLMTGILLPSIEMNELQYPTRVSSSTSTFPTIPERGVGAGAPGLETEIQHLTDSYTNVMMAGVRNPARGFLRRRRRRARIGW